MTQYSTLNDERIVSGNITVPSRGLWVADLVLASTIAITSPCIIRIANLQLVGSLYRQASFSGSRSLRLVAGYGGWARKTPAQGYFDRSGVRVQMILQDAASAVGEKLKLDPATSSRTVGTHYARENKPASDVLRFCLGDEWHIDNDGVTQSTARADNSLIQTDFTVTAWSGSKGHLDVATEDLAAWLPGRSFQNENVSKQRISLTKFNFENDGKMRLSVLTEGQEVF